MTLKPPPIDPASPFLADPFTGKPVLARWIPQDMTDVMTNEQRIKISYKTVVVDCACVHVLGKPLVEEMARSWAAHSPHWARVADMPCPAVDNETGESSWPQWTTAGER